MSGEFEGTPLEDTEMNEIGLVSRPSDRPVTNEERRRMRAEYGRVRTYFKLHPSRYAGIQRSLNQARIGATYDEYLAHSLWFALFGGLFGAVLGVLLTALLVQIGVLSDLRSPIQFSGGLARYIEANRSLFAGGAITIVLTGLVGAGIWFGRYYYPASVVTSRRQAIDVTLPHAIVYMYALSYGGQDLLGVLRDIADAEEVYGEVANEFEMVVNDIDLFGSDMYSALQSARNLTPSDRFEGFLDDMLGVLDAGGDVTTFFESEAESYLRAAEEEQSDFLETLAIMAEVFVVGFVAAPLFLVVTMVVISLIGGSTISAMSSLIYLVLPVGMLAFLVFIDVLSAPFETPSTTNPPEPTEELPFDLAELDDDQRYGIYQSRARRLALRELFSDPAGTFKDEPLNTLLVTVPLALVALVVAVAAGLAEPSLSAFSSEPVRTTGWLVVVPFLLVTVPLSVFVEMRAARQKAITERFPDTLNILASANKMGIPLPDALELISRYQTGPVAQELRSVKNDIAWNHDVSRALLSFGARLKTPQLSRSMKLLSDGLRSSGDLARVLSIAAEDARDRARIERARRRELAAYIAVVVIGFLVYLMVIVILDASYLRPIATLDTGGASQDLPLSFDNIPVDLYRMLFLHSALIQAIGSGLLAGKLAENDSLVGLKYAIGLVVLTMAVFVLV
ncbi:type II secretion system F family protein [Haloglomus halophilum]|uniref:type II secretion system F family protein n=1 Tax=Haloglomus halophilum TaxID=2962672 RepID=UPI0020C96B64|nr:type II secretion system F family protein [Haloglomus halophilum]